MLSFVLYGLLLIFCFVVLVKGADFLVDAASSIASALKIPSVIIGLTIVAFGTSVPEAGVSIASSLNGINELSISNVVGSNLFNLLVVVGLCAVIKEFKVDDDIRKRDYPISLFAAVLLVIFAIDLKISRVEGLILLFIIIGYVVFLISTSIRSSKVVDIDDPEDAKVPANSVKKVLINLLIVAVSVVAVYLGSRGVVYSCSFFASALGVSDTIIGVTVVALGTSLPELVTSIVASKKGENEIAIGNVVGSNIFNILFVLGAASTISPIDNLLKMNFIDTIICLVGMAFCYMFVLIGKKFRRIDGAIMLVLYVAFMCFVVLREMQIIVI
ncbi:MAG: calcium/sodium antiporter [Clostridia bacterium]|nr:calcium/sodium antiporter [Clostridia bacterium]